MVIRRWLLTASIPLQKLIQKIHPPEPKTTFFSASSAELCLDDGDILLSREKMKFSNLFIPGYWSHAAIYGRGIVIEAVPPKVQAIGWIDWVMRKHSWCVLRPTGMMVNDGRQAFKRATSRLGLDYDYLFETNKAWYCSELVYDAWSPRWVFFTRRKTFGTNTVTPDDFFNAVKSGKLSIIMHHRDP